MKKIDLLTPRFKVIADYPNSFFDIGEITENEFTLIDLEKYPHLFKKLGWWEDREIEELPQYLKSENQVFKVSNYFYRIHKLLFSSYDDKYDQEFDDYFLFNDYEPSTEEEYNEYLKNLKL